MASPVYKAAYSGVLRVLLDLLPQWVFGGKVVLPAHALAVDYVLRPVLVALEPTTSCRVACVLDKHITRTADGVELDAAGRALFEVVDWFSQTLRANAALVPP